MNTPTPRTDKMSQLKDELENERAIVSRIWVQLGSPTYAQLKGRSIYDLIDEMKAELTAEREKAERYRLVTLKQDAELATERARLRQVALDACKSALIKPMVWSPSEYFMNPKDLGKINEQQVEACVAAIDAAMTEGAK